MTCFNKWKSYIESYVITAVALLSFFFLFECNTENVLPKGVRFNYIFFYNDNPACIFYSSVIRLDNDSIYKCMVYQELKQNFSIKDKIVTDDSYYEITPNWVQFGARGKTINHFIAPNSLAIGDSLKITAQGGDIYIVLDSINLIHINNDIGRDTCYFFSTYMNWGKTVDTYSPKLKMVIRQLVYSSEGNFNFNSTCELKSFNYIY